MLIVGINNLFLNEGKKFELLKIFWKWFNYMLVLSFKVVL